MFGSSRKQITPTNHRFPKLSKALDEGDVQLLLSEAASRRGITVELPFTAAADTFMLTVRYSDEQYEPTWSYYHGDTAQAQMLWRHATGDVNLVLNLCSTSGATTVSGDSYQAVAPQSLPHLTQQQQSSTTRTLTNIDLSTGAPMNIQALAAASAANPAKQASLEGDLSNMQIPTLLQSISMSKMTGRLHIQNPASSASIYFSDGNPTHALTAETVGDPAIVEMITWEEGQFHFYPDENSAERTVKRRVDALLMEGVTLLDQNKYVREQGLKPQSYLFRKQERMTEEQFKQALATKGAPLDLDKQKQFYSQIDNSSTLMDVLRRMPMIRNEWVPVMFNMLTCGLVGISDTAPTTVSVQPIIDVPPFDIDRSAIQGVVRALTRQETGVYTYPAFLFFVEHEFSKCASMGAPLSVLVLEPKLRIGNEYQSLPTSHHQALLKRIESVKRPFDGLGHFETFDYGLFLPATPARSAKVFALHLVEMFAQELIVPRTMGQLSLFIGIAAAPEDTQELSTLLSAARESKNRGRNDGRQVTVFKELGGR